MLLLPQIYTRSLQFQQSTLCTGPLAPRWIGKKKRHIPSTDTINKLYRLDTLMLSEEKGYQLATVFYCKYTTCLHMVQAMIILAMIILVGS
ncbi:hypothetical protein LAZ67_3004460 [Cordylochernes scorpioides]|uniref:Uncharacterized protein n=1 Tax=Cordylochernes scorpioides TaxID=51811 RepID=A0ABY6K9D3_9ARAC|nr:hypothetical protein LAZ67_3004460 [Cordylochernes scorpioides]